MGFETELISCADCDIDLLPKYTWAFATDPRVGTPPLCPECWAIRFHEFRRTHEFVPNDQQPGSYTLRRKETPCNPPS